MKKLKLGILDQSIVRTHSTAREAVEETIATAKLAEQLGYSRFWISEHHNSSFIAGSAPEVLMVKLADETNHIRIGSGGIMLPNHSAFKVAENFRMLETLFPGRIDLGIGRAPGGDRLSASLLNPSNDFSETSYLKQLEHLQLFFTDTATTQNGTILAIPQATTIPLQWILSSSGGSSKIAAQYGLGLVVAKFINGFARPDIVETYRNNFKPSSQFSTPRTMLSITVLCGETEEKARQMRKYYNFVLLQFEKGNTNTIPDYKAILQYTFSPGELERIEQNRGRVISGTKEEVYEQLTQLANDFDVDEMIISTMGDTAENRKRSFELVADVFELQPVLV